MLLTGGLEIAVLAEESASCLESSVRSRKNNAGGRKDGVGVRLPAWLGCLVGDSAPGKRSSCHGRGLNSCRCSSELLRLSPSGNSMSDGEEGHVPLSLRNSYLYSCSIHCDRVCCNKHHIITMIMRSQDPRQSQSDLVFLASRLVTAPTNGRQCKHLLLKLEGTQSCFHKKADHCEVKLRLFSESISLRLLHRASLSQDHRLRQLSETVVSLILHSQIQDSTTQP